MTQSTKAAETATATTGKDSHAANASGADKATEPAGGTKATPSTTTDDSTADRTGARTVDAADVITGARARIDALDERIIGLVRERMAVSALIQESRISSGGRRVNLSREMEILSHYRNALGRPGTSLAMTLLELSRGRI